MSDGVAPSNRIGRLSVIATHRLWVIRAGLLLSWASLVMLVILAVIDGVLDTARVWAPVVALVVVGAALTAMPWRRHLDRASGDFLVTVWMAGVVVGLIVANEVRAEPPLVAGFAGIVVFAAAVLVAPVHLIATGGIAIAGYLVAVADSTHSPSVLELAAQLLTLGLVSALAVLVSVSVRRHLAHTSSQLDRLREREGQLERQEADLTRLYTVSRTIGAGTSIGEVLPELVGTVAAAVGARVGVVLFYDPDTQALEVVSPIWVSGHALRAEGYRLRLTEPGLVQRVFIDGEGSVSHDVGETEDRLLADLSADSVAAVPLQLEAQTLGVLMVTDKRIGVFDEADLATLESLAAPAALILNHLAQFQEARETSARMSELARLKTDFVSVVSHELRTPLTSIIGALATLARPELAPDDPNARELVGSARRQADRLKDLIEDLLVVSRLDNRALPIRPEPVSLATFVKDLIRTLPETDNVIRIDVPDDLPVFETDREHLARILTNLLDNAFRYAPGSPVDIVARVTGSEMVIAVADHGPGIAYELHDHVFERFTQLAQPETRHRGGVGLGLSIVRGLAEALGGRVWFEPTIGGGATFLVAVPLRAGAWRPRRKDAT